MLREFLRWTERMAAAASMSWRLRYVRKSTETSERQVASHAQQIEAMDQKWGALDPIWVWRDNASGTSFDRPAYQDLLDFCRQNPAPKSVGARIELYDPSRFARVLDADGEPDLIAYQTAFNTFESLGWPLHFVSRERTGSQLVDSMMISVDAYNSAAYSQKLSRDVRRGVREHTKAGWWTRGGAPWGTKRLDTRTGRLLEKGELATSGGGGVSLVPDPVAIELWNQAARRIVSGASLEAVGRELYEEGYLGLRGGRLGHSAIKKLLTNRALIGRVQYMSDGRGERARHEVPAKWPSMVDVDLFDHVATRLSSRTVVGGGRHRRKRELYPLAPVCAHCGLEYNGGRNKAEQGSKRCYTHANPKRRAQPELYEQMHVAGCSVWSVDAGEIETQIKDLIVRERASENFEQAMRDLLHDRDERRKEAERTDRAGTVATL